MLNVQYSIFNVKQVSLKQKRQQPHTTDPGDDDDAEDQFTEPARLLGTTGLFQLEDSKHRHGLEHRAE